MQLALEKQGFDTAISASREMAAYEALWQAGGAATFKRIADMFRSNQGVLPSELLGDDQLIDSTWEKLSKLFVAADMPVPGVRVNGSIDYPGRLRDARNPLELFYYQGDWDLAYSPAVAIVGARESSQDGVRRAAKLARLLVADGYTVVSGLAKGIDTAAHTAAIDAGGKTIAVIGTPLTENYPRENAELQKQIAENHLLISQVPFLHYSQISDFRMKRGFFPERNVTMSALTEATVIVEASESSGTLYQARAALAQGRKLFVMDNCFKNSSLTWPKKFLEKGAIRVKNYADVAAHLEAVKN
jgi:DNA processing protein